MGHTVSTQRMVLENIVNELNSYGKALRKEDRIIFEQILKQAFKHFGSISYANCLDPWPLLLLSILVEQNKRIKTMEELYESLVNGLLPLQQLDNPMD
jgi:hypothetical protein